MTKTFLTAASAAALGFALLASPASANPTTCYGSTVATMQVAWAEIETAALTPNGVKVNLEDKRVADSPAAASKRIAGLFSSKLPERCRPLAAQNVLAFAGLGQQAEPAVAAPPAPKPAATSAPAQTATTSAPAGGGAMLDAKIAELEARLASANTPAEVQAAQAALADAVRRAEEAAEAAKRASAAAAKQMVRVNRPGVSPQAINAAAANLQEAQRQLGNANEQLDAIRTLAGQAKSSADDAARSAGIAATAQAETATLREGAAASATRAKSEADRAETAAKNAEASGGFGWQDWLLWVLLPILVLGIVIYIMSLRLATKADLTTKADTETTDALVKGINNLDARLTDTEDQVGKKIVEIAADVAVWPARVREGAETMTAVMVDGKIFEVQLRKGTGSEVFIVSGLDKSHNVNNPVMAPNLIRVLRSAAYNGRLDVEVNP